MKRLISLAQTEWICLKKFICAAFWRTQVVPLQRETKNIHIPVGGIKIVRI